MPSRSAAAPRPHSGHRGLNTGTANRFRLTSAPERTQDTDMVKQAIRHRNYEDDVEALRLRTTTGRPLGGDRFIAKLETALNRRLRPLPVGRPSGTANRKRKGPK